MTKDHYIQAAAPVRTQVLAWARIWLRSADAAEDVAQEVLLRLWLMHESLPDAEAMRRMSRTITHNLCANLLRDAARHATTDIDAVQHASDLAADAPLLERENAERLRRAAAQIPDRHRTILYLRNTRQMPYADIAAALGTTESSVRGMLCKARAALMQQLKKD